VAHKFRRSMFGIGDASKAVTARPSDRPALRRTNLVLLAIVSAVLTCLAAQAQTSTYVPAVVVSSVSPVPTTAYPLPLTGQQTNLKSPTEVALDACGNIYTFDHGYDGSAPVTEIPAGGGFATAVIFEGNTYGNHMGQDASHANLLVGNNYGTSAQLIPLSNCLAQPSQAKNVGGGPGALFYYYDPGEMAGDFIGNTYITTSGTCCVTGNYYLIQEVNSVGNILLSNQPNELLSPAVDKFQNVYFITGGSVYELPYSGGVYAKAPVAYGKYINPVGLSMDFAGNLYVADSSAGAIYEIPSEAAVTFTGTTATASTSVTAVSATTGLYVGQSVTGAGILPEPPSRPSAAATSRSQRPQRPLELRCRSFRRLR